MSPITRSQRIAKARKAGSVTTIMEAEITRAAGNPIELNNRDLRKMGFTQTEIWAHRGNCFSGAIEMNVAAPKT